MTYRKVEEFLDNLRSEAPAPGGGSAASVSAALAASLAAMVCRLTLKNKEYAHHQIEKVLEKAEEMRVNFLRLARRDEDAFNQVVAAFKLPKGSFEEQQKREKSIQEAFRQAALAPFETARLSVELLELLEQHKEEINKNAITDWGVAAHLAHAALEGALLNVKINLQSLDEVSFVNDFKEKIRALLTTGEKLYQSVKQTLTSHGL